MSRERAGARGRYTIECRGADGELKWREAIENVVCTEGKDLMLDTTFAGATYTVTGPFIGLISSVSFVGVDAADTMASHVGWVEAGGANAPGYAGTRQLAVWLPADAGAKELAADLSFGITSTGTLKGAFLVFGTGAVATKDDTNGALWSAGTFTAGDKPVINGDILSVSYSTRL